jgi:hypothetical protein
MTKPWIKVLEKVQLFERAHSPNESNTESSGFKINFTECTTCEEHDGFSSTSGRLSDCLIDDGVSNFKKVRLARLLEA